MAADNGYIGEGSGSEEALDDSRLGFDDYYRDLGGAKPSEPVKKKTKKKK